MVERLKSFKESLKRLQEILQERKTIANRDSSIKRFELTFELAWKVLQDVLKREGAIARSPRECFQGAFKLGIIQDHPNWIKMIEDRNLSIHTYDEKLANHLYGRLKLYLHLFEILRTGVENGEK